ncbi:MAG TPA: hypothetical protein VFL53_06165 [Pseudolabrys sp.]|nr:hypothetical protein [Pseudolabrys sp.]
MNVTSNSGGKISSAALNDVHPAAFKSDPAAKGFIDRAGAVQA